MKSLITFGLLECENLRVPRNRIPTSTLYRIYQNQRTYFKSQNQHLCIVKVKTIFAKNHQYLTYCTNSYKYTNLNYMWYFLYDLYRKLTSKMFKIPKRSIHLISVIFGWDPNNSQNRPPSDMFKQYSYLHISQKISRNICKFCEKRHATDRYHASAQHCVVNVSSGLLKIQLKLLSDDVPKLSSLLFQKVNCGSV